MALADLFIRNQALENERDQAQDFARERYDPNTLNPIVNQARQQATEGIPQGIEEQQRLQALEQIFRPTDTAVYGGNQARAIAGQQQRDQQAQQAFSDFQSQLTQQDIQAQQQGRQQFAQARSQQRQVGAQRDAAVEQAELQYQQELDRRRQKVGSTVGNVAGTAAGILTGNPAVGAAVGGGLGGIFGGGGGALTGAGAGLSSGMQEQRLDEFMGQQQTQTEGTGEVGNLSSDTQSAINFGNQLLQTEGQQQDSSRNLNDLFSVVDFGNQLLQQQPQRPQVPQQQVQDQIFQEDVGGLEQSFVSNQQIPTEPPLSFEEFQRQQGMEAVSQSPTFGGYGQQGQGQRVYEGLQGTGSFLYDRFSDLNSILSEINPLEGVRRIIKDRQRQQYEQYLQGQQ